MGAVGIARRHQTTTARSPGEVVGNFILERMIEDGPSAHIRRWIIRCRCGWTSRKYETQLSSGRLGCANCAYEAKRKKDT